MGEWGDGDVIEALEWGLKRIGGYRTMGRERGLV
jgi:hypothetical protein